MRRYFYIMSISAMTMSACVKPYTPPTISSDKNYLVVEGVIDPGSDSTIIKLSRTGQLSEKVTVNPELGAVLTVESDQGVIYPLSEAANGMYLSSGLNLGVNRKYRLRIKTGDNQQYLSDFVPVKITPPIDSVGFNIAGNGSTGIQIYANTHDANNSTRYYRWDYDETWQFHAKYISYYMSNGSSIVRRPFDKLIFYCFANDASSNIVLGSSAKLKQDVIYQSHIIFIPSTSEKIEMKYSILLREYALTSDAFVFWENLKKNTEQLGSIFDAQP